MLETFLKAISKDKEIKKAPSKVLELFIRLN